MPGQARQRQQGPFSMVLGEQQLAALGERERPSLLQACVHDVHVKRPC